MIINNIDVKGRTATYSVTGTGSGQEVSGTLGHKDYAVVTPPGKEPFQVCLDGTLNLTGITQADVVITRYFANPGGWHGTITERQN